MRNEERSEGSVEVDDDDEIKALIDYDRYSSTRGIAKKMDVLHTCVKNRLYDILGAIRNLMLVILGKVS